MIEALRARGLDVLIMTGDDEGPTAALAAELGISRYFARTLPEDKSDIVAQLQAEGRRVCFVGDGINDSLALNRSNEQLEVLFEIADAFSRDQKVIMGSGRLVTTASAMVLLFTGMGLGAIVGVYTASMATSVAVAMRPLARQS